MAASRFDSPRRIGVCGSSKGLSAEAADFCRALGRALGQKEFVTIVSGGTKRRAGPESNGLAADWLIVEAAVGTMTPDLVLERIVTVIREKSSDTEAFELGVPQRARGVTSEARRISFVRDLDALIAVGGRGGTAQEMTLALEHEVPLLPVPTFGGRGLEFWRDNRAHFMRALRINKRIAHRWETIVPHRAATIQRLADEMVDVVLRSIGRRCFVIMPFRDSFVKLQKAIDRAVRTVGDEPIHLGVAGGPGDLKRQIDNGIKYCDYVIAVLDKLRHNVFYELGIAHGRGKPTILLNNKRTFKTMPFDLWTQHRYQYESIDDTFQKRLIGLLGSLTARK